MRKLFPRFEFLADQEYLGMFFKDEGDFLMVNFNKETKQPLGDELIPFDNVVSTYLTREDMSKLTSQEDLKNFLISQIDNEK